MNSAMKAKLMKETALLYHLEEAAPKGQMIRELLHNMRITAVTVEEEDAMQPLGFLAGIPGFERLEAENHIPPAGELIAFYGMSQSRLNQFLSKYKQSGIEPVALKAVVTEHNRHWSLARLLAELQKEHRFFEEYHRLQELYRQTENAGDEVRAAAKRIMTQAEMLFRGENDVNFEKMNEWIQNMEELLS